MKFGFKIVALALVIIIIKNYYLINLHALILYKRMLLNNKRKLVEKEEDIIYIHSLQNRFRSQLKHKLIRHYYLIFSEISFILVVAVVVGMTHLAYNSK